MKPNPEQDADRAAISGYTWVEALDAAKLFVRSSPLFKKFISGTPLENDIPVWMADFVKQSFVWKELETAIADSWVMQAEIKGLQAAKADARAMQDAFEQVCDVFRNIQFVTGGDPKKYPIYAAATEGLRLAEPHCKPREQYVKSGTSLAAPFRKTGV